MKVMILTILIVGIAMLLMSVKVIFKKNGRFSHGHACQFDPEHHRMRKTAVKKE